LPDLEACVRMPEFSLKKSSLRRRSTSFTHLGEVEHICGLIFSVSVILRMHFKLLIHHLSYGADWIDQIWTIFYSMTYMSLLKCS